MEELSKGDKILRKRLYKLPDLLDIAQIIDQEWSTKAGNIIILGKFPLKSNNTF